MNLPPCPKRRALARGGSSITFENVSKSYDGGSHAVEHVDFQVGAGEFFSLLGPSGCGKTTTLRMVAGFENPTSGRVLLGDEDITATRPARRPVNLVFQDYALFPHMTVGDNVAFGLKVKGLARSECTVRVGRGAGVDAAHCTGVPSAVTAIGWSAPAGCAGARTGQPSPRTPARRAARGARSAAAPGDAARTGQAASQYRDDLSLRDARPGGGADAVGPNRGDEPGTHRATRRSADAV